MSRKDQILYSELHGEALLAAKRPELNRSSIISERLRRGVMTSALNVPGSGLARDSAEDSKIRENFH
jgi:hypothetical protein